MDMRKGTCAMAGFAVSSLQRFNASTRGLFCFDPATILRLYCLALTFVFLGTIGALAQTVAVNKPPIADAGPDQTVDSGATITLDASASTVPAGRTIIHYQWLRLDNDFGSYVPVEFISSNRPNPVVQDTAPTLPSGIESRTVYYTLWVTDSGGFESETFSSLTVTVVAPTTPIAPASNKAPEADAGPDQTVASGDRVDLDGSGSTDDDGTVVRYNWRWLESVPEDAPRATLSGFTSVTPWFTAPTLTSGANEISYNLALIVQDNDGTWTDQDKVTVTVAAPNAPPVAEAGADVEVNSGTTPVPLDGRGSMDNGGSIATYLWARTGGTTGASGTLINANMAQASFTPDPVAAGAADVTHVFTLTVTDDDNATDTDMVTITVNAPPLADAGLDRTVGFGAPVTLDGSGSSDTTGMFTYAWMRSVAPNRGNAGTVTLNGANTERPTFTPISLDPGAPDTTYGFTLTVTDSDGVVATDMVTITVTSGLFAEAGNPQTVVSGETVTLDGSGSQTDSTRTVTYAWTRTGGTGGTLTGETTLTPSFTAPALNPGDADVIHEFRLTVSDDQSSTPATDTVEVTVTAPPFAGLTAEAGPDKSVVSGGTVTLDGSGSQTDSTRTVTYNWEQTDGTGGTLTGETTLTPSFTAPALNPGDAPVIHVFTLTVSDDVVGSTEATDTVEITVTATPVVSIESPNAAPDGTIQAAPGETVTLRSVTEVDVESYSWERTGGTGESANLDLMGERTATLTLTFTAGTAQASFVANTPEPGDPGMTHIFTLTVTDSADVTHTAMVTVVVSAVAQVEVGVDPILRPVGEFLAARATALINNQPGLSSFLELDGPTPGGGGSGSFTFQATDGRLSLNGGFLHNGVWGKVSGSRASSESGDTKSVTKSVLGSFGIHRKYSKNFLAGAMLQFDLSDHDRAGQVGTTHTIDGTGWLAGPYFAARHDTRPVYFEGRLLYGQSDNDIRFIDPALGVRTGSFDTRRLLAQLRVEGEIAVSARNHGDHGDDGGADGPRLRPYADARWIEDRAKAFTDNIGNRVPGQKVSIGQLELGSNVEVPVAVRTGEMTLTGGLGLVWSNTEGDYITSDSGGRGRGEIGFSYDLDDNLRIEFESFYDGIGSSRYEGYGLSLSAEMKF